MRAVEEGQQTGTAARATLPLPWIAFAAVAVVALGALVALRLAGSRPPAATTSSGPVLTGEAVMAPGSTPAPNFALSDQNGQTISLQQLRGQVVALTFLDSHCQQQCPVTGDQLGTAMRALGTRHPFVIMVVSVAPATDTSASEAAFASMHRWTGTWYWLSGTPAQLASVWKAYGVDVQPGSPGNIPHSVVTYMIDRRGYERAGLLFTQPARIEQDVRVLATS
jgi:protein SCO1/2